MTGFIEVTDETLKKEVLDFAMAHGRDYDGDVVYYHNDIYYVHIHSGFVSKRNYKTETEEKQEDKDVKSSTVL